MKIKNILKGIDQTENESKAGWWETSTGAEFGTKKLAEVEKEGFMREGKAIGIIDGLLTNQLVEQTMRLGNDSEAKRRLYSFQHIRNALAALKEGREDGYVITLALSDWIDESN